MNMELENKIKAALKDIDSFRTSDCLDDNTIGRYAENKLAEPQRQAAEAHLHTCLYCLKQLNDMTELLHYQKQQVLLSPRLASRLEEILPEPADVKPHGNLPSSIIQRMQKLFTFSQQQWRFSALGLATAWMVFLVSIFVMRQGDMPQGAPQLNSDSFVKVQALSDSGAILGEQQGVVVGSNGLIASNLTTLAGASKLQITLKDGRHFQTTSIWKDEDKNLAVMKFDAGNLPAIPTADIEQISVGQRIFAVADPSKSRKGFQEAMVSDFKEMPGRRKDGAVQYLQIATQTATIARGALVDDHGSLLGFLITAEKHINIAAPVADVMRLAKEGKAIPLSDLKNVTFSAEALNAYMKGILARDALRWDEAEKHFKKAVQLNPRLEGAHLELGYVYYKKRWYDKEAFEYEEALKLNPDDPEALFSLATNLETRGKYEEAIQKYERTVVLDPENGEALYYLGLAYLAHCDKAKAMAVYRRLKRLDPGSAEMLRRLMR
jgi:S1-C subfamily serine protease